MKKAVLATLITSALLVSGSVNAEFLQNTLSGGYAHSHAKFAGEGENLKGFNVKYRHELNDMWGIVGSFAYTNFNKDYNMMLPNANGVLEKTKVASYDLDYFSLTAGPSLRFNEYLSAYALIGVGYGKAHAWLDGYASASEHKTSPAFGAGLQFNPVPNMTIDASYEYSKLGDVKVGTWMAGVGYRF
ncbi:Ail/Lom family outer membrane beta-barrel protein [Salmonella enterica subsp. enterica serovar Brandenburg]|nr:attachment protein [Salmonella enterica subsp. enterica serovar Kasenyi]EDT6458693.1 Ail/Lom family outer membrane beta-barrel protein [Salmonella enterica subsp. enterica]EEE3274510.1 Ail/Lom family outer membrane beta-barrel protein [Salmonella enterica subsp. enterica serovar Braenderup]